MSNNLFIHVNNPLLINERKIEFGDGLSTNVVIKTELFEKNVSEERENFEQCNAEFLTKHEIFDESDVEQQQCSLVKHKQSHTEDKRFSCDFCGTEFSRLWSLVKHKQKHIKSFSCDICDIIFTEKRSLIQHKKIHTGIQEYNSSLIKENIQIEKQLKSEFLIKHEIFDESDTEYQLSYEFLFCNICNKKFIRPSSLKKHLRNHTEDKSFSCDVCDKEFTTKKTLSQHKRVHTGEKYTCDICFKTYIQKKDLSVHKRVHTGEKPFSCDECDKAFVYKKDLFRHKRMHTGIRPYACDFCDKAFFQKNDLVIHNRTHTGEKPYPCDACDKMFPSSSHLAKHKRIHTGENSVTEKRFGCNKYSS
ncbi:zinc finger protein 271-like [Chrysoperla carnea]|uniref:zinc finger protein 271-like n=1 Tax=Chrysoperla carnea TaxID=189513 RepID=UPI001D06E7DA|nr:zinc finger protein 271-like [Chrysoperla carnea]